MNNEFEGIWKKVVVAEFEVLSPSLPGEPEEEEDEDSHAE
jgi:hypothetical protein